MNRNHQSHINFVFLYVIGLILPLSLTATTVEGKDWKAGVAKVDITPKESIWMAGYAARTKPAVGKQHELWAKAVALEDRGGKRSVLVSTDLLGFTKELSASIKLTLLQRYGLSDADILLNSSHTHSGPVLTGALMDIYPFDSEEQSRIDRYTQWLEGRIVEVVSRALDDLQPVRLYSGTGISRFQVNRRNNNAAELLKLTEYNGPSDYAVPVIKIVGAKGKLKALLFSYACHPTTLDGYEWSGDYPGYAQLELEKTYKGAVSLFFQGASADQNPLPRRTVALAKQYGKELAAAVVRVLEEDNMRELQSELKTAYHEIDLPFSPVPTVSELEEIIRVDGDKTYFSRWAHRLIDQIQTGHPLDTVYPYPVQAWKIGDQLLFSLAGEAVVEYAVNLKKKYGWETFVYAYSNDVLGYIPSVKVLEEGGYEGDSSQKVYGLPSKWEPSIESSILDACEKLVEDLE